MNLNKLSQDVLKTSIKRGQIQGEVMKHLAGEVIEATNAKYAFDASLFVSNESAINNLATELADVIICALSCAAQYSIDIEKAVTEKAIYNKSRINKSV